jgi:hypothetical protein
MAATTLSAILTRFETVLQAAPLSLSPAGDPYSSEGISGPEVDSAFRLVPGGLVGQTCQSNYSTARIERIVVTVNRMTQFDAYDVQRALEDQLDAIERAIIADGPDHSYMASIEKGSRKVTRKKDSDVIEASINFLVDFDFSEVA